MWTKQVEINDDGNTLPISITCRKYTYLVADVVGIIEFWFTSSDW